MLRSIGCCRCSFPGLPHIPAVIESRGRKRGRAGEPGVDKALDLLAEQFQRTMRLLGVTSAAELRKRGTELLIRD